jgi:hypothetical protein
MQIRSDSPLKPILLGLVKYGGRRLAIVLITRQKAPQMVLMSKFGQLQTRIQSA